MAAPKKKAARKKVTRKKVTKKTPRTSRQKAYAERAGKKPQTSKIQATPESGTKRGQGTGRGRVSKLTLTARVKFLAELADHGFVSIAAASIGVSRTTMYRWRKEDDDFAQDWDDAVEASMDKLEKEARRRAEAGVVKPVYQGGRQVGGVREFSDSLMALILKGRRRRVYGERKDDGPGDSDKSGVLKVRGTLDDEDWEEQHA